MHKKGGYMTDVIFRFEMPEEEVREVKEEEENLDSPYDSKLELFDDLGVEIPPNQRKERNFSVGKRCSECGRFRETHSPFEIDKGMYKVQPKSKLRGIKIRVSENHE